MMTSLIIIAKTLNCKSLYCPMWLEFRLKLTLFSLSFFYFSFRLIYTAPEGKQRTILREKTSEIIFKLIPGMCLLEKILVIFVTFAANFSVLKTHFAKFGSANNLSPSSANFWKIVPFFETFRLIRRPKLMKFCRKMMSLMIIPKDSKPKVVTASRQFIQ